MKLFCNSKDARKRFFYFSNKKETAMFVFFTCLYKQTLPMFVFSLFYFFFQFFFFSLTFKDLSKVGLHGSAPSNTSFMTNNFSNTSAFTSSRTKQNASGISAQYRDTVQIYNLQFTSKVNFKL